MERIICTEPEAFGAASDRSDAKKSRITPLIERCVLTAYDHPAFGVSIALAFIVMLDASSLRKQVGRQASTINQLASLQQQVNLASLRERIGHTPLEIVAGIVVGVLLAYVEVHAY